MIVRAFGLYWSITGVDWDTKQMLGVDDEDQPQIETNAWAQSGIYCLYDGYMCVYVGKAENNNIGDRLNDHRSNRLAGRWDAFSWFGVHRVNRDGTLQAFNTRLTERADIIKSLEAFAQIAFDPRLNRRHERPPEAVEFIQKAESVQRPFVRLSRRSTRP